MTAPRTEISPGLLALKPSNALTNLPMSQLARTGTTVLRELTESSQAVAITVQGQGAMVTLSQHQYDEMVALIQQLQVEEADDGFTRALSEQFDQLVDSMNQPGAPQDIEDALFADPSGLNKTYQPGSTETTT